MPLSSQLAVVASNQAVADAGIDLDHMDRDRMGVVLGTAGGSSIDETEKAAFKLATSKSARLSPFLGIKVWPNMASYFVAERHNLRGYNMTVCTACASGNQAIGEAAKIIQRGDADLILTGGTEYLLSQTIFASFTMARGLSSSYNDQPEKAMRPFDADRDGFIPGLGSAILVLERLDQAQRRGRASMPRFSGFGASNDSYNLIAPDPDGSGAALAIKNALNDARIHPEAVDYINAHGTSTQLGDKAETNAIKTVFGDDAYQIPISSTKSMVGHMMGAAGAVEAMVSALSIYESRIHPTINYDHPIPTAIWIMCPISPAMRISRSRSPTPLDWAGRMPAWCWVAWTDADQHRYRLNKTACSPVQSGSTPVGKSQS